MQNVGQQYGQGGASSLQNTTFGHSEPTTTSGSITSSLRQFRRKPEEKHASQESHNTSESHVARVAPHSHFPANRISDCYTRYQVQYSDYSTPTQVKYSEISETNQPLQDHLSPSVIQKPKTKDYMEMCNLQQPHMKQAYPDHLGGQQPYTDPNVLAQAQYMPKESQVHSLYKPESQYYPKEPQYPNQLPHQMQKFNMPAQVRKFPENEFLSKLQRIHPSMARSIMSDHHLQESQRTYQNMDQSRMYPHHNQRYINHSTSMQGNLYPHSYMPPQHYPNYPPSCSYTRNTQMAPRFPHINPHDRSISPRRSFTDGVTMPINYGGIPQKISPNYPQYSSPDYSQHYQQRRSSVTQDYYQPHCRPTQYLPPQMPSQEIPENRVTVSDSIKQYIENWADEETATEMNQIENNRLCKENVRTRDDQPTETVYTINASDVQYLEPLVAAENGIPVVSSENGQYIIKSGVSIDNSSGMIRIIDKNNPMDFSEINGERIVNLHIMDTVKPDCMLANKPNEINQRQTNENVYNVNDKSRVVIHQNTVIQSSFQNSSNTKEPLQQSNILEQSKMVSSLPVISDDQKSLEEELNRTIIRECRRETADKNCSPINLDQLEDFKDDPVQPSVIYPGKPTSPAMDKVTEVESSSLNIKNMPILEPHDNIENKQNILADEQDKAVQKDGFEEIQNAVEEKLNETEKEKETLKLDIENSNKNMEMSDKIEENSERILENSGKIEESLNAITEETNDFEETTYNIQEEIDKMDEKSDKTAEKIDEFEEKLDEIEKIDEVEQPNKCEELNTDSHLSKPKVNKEEIILNNILKENESTKYYSEEHINEQEVLKSEIFSLTEKMEQIIEDNQNTGHIITTNIQPNQIISSIDSNSKESFDCSMFYNSTELKDNITSGDLSKNQNNMSSEQEISTPTNILDKSEFQTDKESGVIKQYFDNKSDLPNIQESSEDTSSNTVALQKAVDSDLFELHRPYEESTNPTKNKRSRRIFSVDDIINNIGNNSNKFKGKEERRYSLKSTKEFLNHEIERASLLMQEISVMKYKHNESKNEYSELCIVKEDQELDEKSIKCLLKENTAERCKVDVPNLIPDINEQDVASDENIVQSSTFEIQKEILADDLSIGTSNSTVTEPEEESVKMDNTDLEEIKTLADEEILSLTDKEIKPLADEEILSLADKEIKPLTEEETKLLADEEAKPVVDEEIKPVDEEIKRLADEETKPFADEEIKPLVEDEMESFAELSIEKAPTVPLTQEFPLQIIAEGETIEKIKKASELDNKIVSNKIPCIISENVDHKEYKFKEGADPAIKNFDLVEKSKPNFASLETNSDNEIIDEKSEPVETTVGESDTKKSKSGNSESMVTLESETEAENFMEEVEIASLQNKSEDNNLTETSNIETDLNINSDDQLKLDVHEQECHLNEEVENDEILKPDDTNLENFTNDAVEDLVEDQEELLEDKSDTLPENSQEKIIADHVKQIEEKVEKLHDEESVESYLTQIHNDKESEYNLEPFECTQESIECNQESSRCHEELFECDQVSLDQKSLENKPEKTGDSKELLENKTESPEIENKQKVVENKQESVVYFEESDLLEETHNQEIHYRNVIRVEEPSVLLHIAGELVEINVNTINGKRVITVVPLSSSAVVDLNDNYETLDSNEDTDPLKIDGEEKNVEPLEFENCVTQPTFIEPTSEIIIGMDLSLEEEIQLDLEQPLQTICTKAAKKAYESDLQIPSITTSEDVYDHTKISSYSFNDKVSSSHEQCASKKRKNTDEQKSPVKSDNTKPKAFKKREVKNVKTVQEIIVNDEDDEFVPFKELIKARKLKKMRLQEIKKCTEIKADSTNKIDEVVKENNDTVDVTIQGIKNTVPSDKRKDVKKAKKPSAKTSITKEKKEKLKDMKQTPEKLKSSQISSSDKIKKADKYSIQEKAKKVTFSEEGPENDGTTESKKPLDQDTDKNEIEGDMITDTRILNDSIDGKKKLSLEEYNSRKRKSTDKSETEHIPKKIVSDIVPEVIRESPSATGTGHINKLRTYRPKSLDDVNLLKSRENSFTKRKLSAESCIVKSQSYDWEETQSPKCVTKDKHFNEFSGLISGNKGAESKSAPPKVENPDVILQNYKEQVESKLSSLNIQIPRGAKPVSNTLSQIINPFSKTETTSLMRRFLRNDRLTSEEMQKIRKIISYKRLMQQLRTINSPIVSSPSVDLNYEVKRELGERDMKLHLKKLPLKRRKKRFRNLYSESTTESDSDCSENKTSGDYSVVQSNCLAGVVPKLIIKRKPEMPLPFVKLERLDMGMLINKKRRYVD